MTQCLEVVHQQPFSCNQVVVAAKLYESAQRSDLSLCKTFYSTKQTVLYLNESVVLYISSFHVWRLTLKKQQITLSKLNFLTLVRK